MKKKQRKAAAFALVHEDATASHFHIPAGLAPDARPRRHCLRTKVSVATGAPEAKGGAWLRAVGLCGLEACSGAP